MEILPVADKANVRIACENLWDEYARGIHETILGEYNHPILGLCYDSSHANLTEDPLEFLREYGDRLYITHLSDNRGEYDDHLLPGMGAIDWKRIISAIANTPFSGPLLIEVERDSSGYLDRELLEFTSDAYAKAEWLWELYNSV